MSASGIRNNRHMDRIMRDEIVGEVLRLYRLGHDDDTIALAVGRAAETVKRMRCQAGARRPVAEKRSITKQQRIRVARFMLQAGESADAIAQAVGVTKDTVKAYIRQIHEEGLYV